MKYLGVLIFFLTINSAGAVSEFWGPIAGFLDEAKVRDFINQLTSVQRFLLIGLYIIIVGTVISIIYNFVTSFNLVGIGITIFLLYLFWEDILFFFFMSLLLFY